MISKYGFETTIERSRLMARIKGKNTKPELILRKAFWSRGIRYRLNVAKLPGKPDIVIRKYKLIIFIDGEFWHGYNWEDKKLKLKSNRDYWINKIEGNMKRDKVNNHLLQQQGYTVLIFWEKEINSDLEGCVGKVVACSLS
ncbi:MAG: very short patch repair endonuclease [Bacteroidetes bacterium]|nr:very short patch repair endonuclease [Bacteroidota bacterium]